MNQLYIGIESMPKIKKTAVEVVKQLQSKFDENDSISLEKLL